VAFFTEVEQTVLKFICNHRRHQINQAILRKKYKAGVITLPNFELYYKATVIKTIGNWHKNRHLDQWNRIKNPEINLWLYGQLIYEQTRQEYAMEKRQFFNK